jgi:hypothetical protein
MLTTMLVLCLLLGSGYALTAGNVFNGNGKAGDGTTNISGYTISGVSYALNPADPTKIQSWTITFAAGSGTLGHVYSQLLNGSTSLGGWVDCGSGAGPSFTCTPGSGSQPATASANNIQIAAAS